MGIRYAGKYIGIPGGYAGRDSLHYGVDSVQPESRECPLDIPIKWFESPGQQKEETPDGVSSFWYAGRDSNPQPSEPESDALSIEPPAHILIARLL